MKRLLPKSLLGQMLLLLGAALLVAQLVNFAVILSGQQRLSLAESEGPAINRFVQVAALVSQDAGPFGGNVATRQLSQRGARFSLDSWNLVDIGRYPRSSEAETRLLSALGEAGVTARQVRAATDLEPLLQERRDHRGPEPGDRGAGDREAILLAAELDDGTWLNGRLDVPRRDPWLIVRLASSTFALYALALGAVLWIGFRMARPLRDLTAAAQQFETRREAGYVVPRGPADIRKALEAFNDMNRQVGALLDEKDRMLGAIGHDLRTPLASLRIRAENMKPAAERSRMVATIDEMAGTIDDILVLARTGRSGEQPRPVDIGALVDALAEEYIERGKDVSFTAGERLVALAQVNLLRRAVRNLIDNALAYGERARVKVRRERSSVLIEVEDDGPGIPSGQLENVLQPFRRLENSRNRDSGGAGLGLAIANAVALGQGGSLQLTNRPGGGILATLAVPISG